MEPEIVTLTEAKNRNVSCQSLEEGKGGLVKRSKGEWASGAIVASAVSYTRSLLKEQVLKAVAAKEGNQKERREEEGRGKHVR